MNWFTERLQLFKDALTLRQVLALSAIFATFSIMSAFSAQIGKFLTGGSPAALLGAPPWSWGVIASVLVLCWYLLEHALGLKRELTPKIKASYDQWQAGVSFAIERVAPNALNAITDFKAVYVRFRVEATTKRPVRDCTAHLIRLWKIDPHAGLPVEISLPHVIQVGPPQFDVLPYAYRMIDFLRCSEADNKLTSTATWPIHMESVFGPPATYRFKFAIEGEGVTETLAVQVHWTGEWRNIKGEQIQIDDNGVLYNQPIRRSPRQLSRAAS